MNARTYPGSVGDQPNPAAAEPDDTSALESRHRANTAVVHETFLNRARQALRHQRRVCADPTPAARAVFTDVLDQAENTYFGRKHGLSRVRTLRDWKQAVPVRRYTDFEPFIDKILDGDRAVLTTSEPYALLKTSGTSGRPKLIPTTRHWRNTYRGRALYAQWGLYFQTIGFDQARGAAVLDLSWERAGSTADRAGEYAAYCISQRPSAVGSADWLPPWYDEGWFRAVDGEDYTRGLYRKLRLLAGSDVRVIVALNPSKIINLIEVLGARGEDLIADLRDGTLDGRRCDGGRDRELAAHLARVLQTRQGTLRLSDLWPNLSLIVSWNSASAALYRPWLDELTPGIAKLPFSATGTEGIITIPVDDHPAAGPLAVDLGLYEFVPTRGRDNPVLEPDVETLDFHELEVGESYQVVMTQGNGLYRYDVGDCYRVVGRIGAVPRLDFVGRSGFGSSFTGEKLTEEDVHHAVRAALGDRWSRHSLFTCVPVWSTPPGYTLAIELPAHGPDHAELADRVERELQQVNIEYAEKRRTGRLTPLRVRALPAGSFAGVDERRRQEGASPAQLKHHWIQRDDAILGHLDALAGGAATARGRS